MRQTILIVDDELKPWISIGPRLREAGYESVFASYGVDPLQYLLRLNPCLVLLSVSAYKPTSWNLSSEIRKTSDVPLIIVFDRQATKNDLLKAFDLGADECVIRPFEFDVLFSRMKALLRRSDRTYDREPKFLNWDSTTIDFASCSVVVDGATVHLDKTEWRLLRYLAQNANQVVTREQISGTVWEPANSGDKTLVKVYVHCLRRKIEKDPSRPRYILSKGRMGYCLVIGTSARSVSE